MFYRFFNQILVPALSQSWRWRGIWLRALLCWIIALSFCYFESLSTFDWRFRLRGPQPKSDKIIIVYLDQEDWSIEHGQSQNFLRSLKEFSTLTDSFYWNPDTWKKLLSRILAQSPAAVGVTFFFSPELSFESDTGMVNTVKDSRIIWTAHIDNEGRPIFPAFSTSYGYNTALVDLRVDDDQVLRRFATPMSPVPHMALKLSEPVVGSSLSELNMFLGESRLINFRGAPHTFPSISASEILKKAVSPNLLRDKIVIIGSRAAEGHRFQTPVGLVSRAEILAHVTDNVMSNRWINHPRFEASAFYLLLILLVSVAILMLYLHSVALISLLWMATLLCALSLWVFDAFYLWIPTVSPLLELLAVYVIFVSYQLAIKEGEAWRLERERVFISELDQLKNNFVSLISHDLKTPIAKIQAICDRLLAEPQPKLTADGLTALRKENEELHRYIQSILQISRLESSQLKIRRDAVDLNSLAEKVCEQILPFIRDKGQTLIKNLEPLFSLEIDGVLIQEVILNLVENATKYTPDGGQIIVNTQEIDDKVIFSVQDNGPGISNEDQQRIFEKFYRGREHRAMTKGTGLGLFLVKYFVELHGGTVFLESQFGRGTRVGFTLPLQAEGT